MYLEALFSQKPIYEYLKDIQIFMVLYEHLVSCSRIYS